MKNAPLIALVLVVLGWTALAAGVIATLAGHPAVISTPHHHRAPPARMKPVSAPLLSSDAPCPADGVDAAVPCQA